MGRPKLPPKGLVTVTVEQACAAFLTHLETGEDRLAAETMKQKRVIMSRLREKVGEDRELWTLTRADFEAVMRYACEPPSEDEAAWRKQMGKRPRTGRTSEVARKAVALTLRQFATYASVHNDWLDPKVTLLKPVTRGRKETQAEPEAKLKFEPEMWPRILAEAERIHMRCRMAVALGLWCGRRCSEAVNTQWKHIDWNRNRIRFYNVKIGELRHFYVPLSPEFRAELERWRAWATRTYGEPQPDWYLVPARIHGVKGTGMRSELLKDRTAYPVDMTRKSATGSVIKDSRRVLEALGYGDMVRAGTHTWRRSAATAIARTTRDLRKAQVLLNHKNVTTTQIYTGNDDGYDALEESLLAGGAFGIDMSEAPDNVRPLRPKGATNG